MKLLLTSVTLVLFFSFQKLNAQETNKKKTRLETDGYNGKLKQVEQHSWQAIEKDGEIVQGKKNGTYQNHYVNKYDQEGNKIEENTFGLNGTLRTKVTMIYNEKGNRIEMNGYNSENTPDMINYKILYKHDEMDNCTDFTVYKSDSSIERSHTYSYKHDDAGDLIETNSFRSGKVPDGKHIFKYDSKHNQIEDTYDPQSAYEYQKRQSPSFHLIRKFDEKGNVIEADFGYKKYTYKYDDRGNTSEWYEYNSKGKLVNKDVKSFDDHGNFIEEYFYKGSGKLVDKHVWKYKYDTEGNWIERIELKDDKPTTIIVRQLEYFP